MKTIKTILAFAVLFVSINITAQSTSIPAAKLSKKWKYLLDENFSNFDKFTGVPHYSITSLPDYPKGDGMKGTPIGLNKDPLNGFTVVYENNEPVLKISGEIYAGLSTKEEYDNYHLSVQFKWGEKKYEPRLNNVRDNGILYHCSSDHAAFWNVWMESIEFQVQENDMGDLYALSKRRLQVRCKRDTDGIFVYDPKGELVTFGWATPEYERNGRVKAIPHYEKPNGEWNVLELFCLGDMSVHVVNGVVVNVIVEDTKTTIANNEPFLRKGKIQFQSEGAEAYYKDVKIRKISKLPSTVLKQL
jgi:hypothetical protein